MCNMLYLREGILLVFYSQSGSQLLADVLLWSAKLRLRYGLYLLHFNGTGQQLYCIIKLWNTVI